MPSYIKNQTYKYRVNLETAIFEIPMLTPNFNPNHYPQWPIDDRTLYIVRLIGKKTPPELAEAMAFAIYGNPLTNQDNGGRDNG